MPIGSGMRLNAGEWRKRYAAFWVGLTRKHPVGMPVVDLIFYVALVSLAWIFIGPTAGGAALALTLGLYGWGVVRVVRRRRGTGD
jgi:hypothetical protein